MGISRTYIDSLYLIEIIINGTIKQDVEYMLSKITRDGYKVFISQIVLGETIAKILQLSKKNEFFSSLEKFGSIIKKYNIDVNTCLVAPNKSAFMIMRELQKRDEFLDMTDIMILSYVLADPESKFFFTHDAKLLDNKIINEYEQELREKGSRIRKLKIIEQI